MSNEMGNFVSILFDRDGFPPQLVGQPDGLTDLNLDQIIDAITGPKQEYQLTSFFHTPLRDPTTVLYRQEVMRDLENDTLMEYVKAFAKGMETVRRYLNMVDKLTFEHHKKGWLLEAALVYCDTVRAFAHHLAVTPLKSSGLSSFRMYLEDYVSTPAFGVLTSEAQQVKQALAGVQYALIIENGKFRVKRYEGEVEYGLEVERTFEKFKQTGAHDYLTRLPERSGMSHIEAKILEFVAKLFPEPFAALDRFYIRYTSFVDATIQTFDREIQFYVAYLDFIADFKSQGLPFCYPQVSTTNKEIYLYEGFDLALAHARRHNHQPIVPNDFLLRDAERILVVTGPNQGGKTTFARMVGQVHYLASLGCPVPGREARLFLFDHIFTHFERAEDIRNLRGKLEDDLVRLHAMLARASADSLFILNEIFTSTTVHDALFLSKKIMERLADLDAPAVWVTFLDELASLNEKTVSMVALVDPEDPAKRTFEIIRRAADGQVYALALARKHRLTSAQIQERFL